MGSVKQSIESRHVNMIKDFNNGNKINRNPQRIANTLNEHFASVGEKSGVKLKMSALPNNNSHRLYSCPTRLLKYSSAIISDILAKIVNLSVISGSYPSKLKKAKVIPVFQTEDETDAHNYRPITLLSIFDRIFEKVMYKRMIHFINFKNILFSSQYGFREGFSTEHAIVDIVCAIQSNMDKRLFTRGIFIDLRKVFDTFNHQILLKKLNYYGFRGVINNRFESFLCNRSQTLEINKQISDTALISRSVVIPFIY